MSTRMHAIIEDGITVHIVKTRKGEHITEVKNKKRAHTQFWKNKRTPGKYTPEGLRALRAKQTKESLDKQGVEIHDNHLNVEDF